MKMSNKSCSVYFIVITCTIIELKWFLSRKSYIKNNITLTYSLFWEKYDLLPFMKCIIVRIFSEKEVSQGERTQL